MKTYISDMVFVLKKNIIHFINDINDANESTFTWIIVKKSKLQLNNYTKELL